MSTLDSFVDEHKDLFDNQSYTTLKEAWELYRKYVEDTGLTYTSSMIRFREELKNYFGDFTERLTIAGVGARGVYQNFKSEDTK